MKTVQLTDPQITTGGFAGHCSNNDKIQYNFYSNDKAKVIRMKLGKNGQWKSKYGKHIIQSYPAMFYDYNF